MAVYQDKDNRSWFCKFRYKDWTGKTRMTTKRGFARKKDALQYEMDFKNRSQETSDITLSALAEKYLADYKVNRKYTSYVTVKARIQCHILPYFGDAKVSDITPMRIKDWQNHIKASNVSSSLIRSINVSFSAMLNFAVKYYNLAQNPFVKTGKIGKIAKRVEFWELEDYMEVSSSIDKPDYKVPFDLLFWSGMRIGELLALKAEDFDFDNNTISITKTYNTGLKMILSPKTASGNRVISMPEAIMEETKEDFASMYDLPEYPFRLHRIFTYRDWLKRYAEKNGKKVIHLHDLRHSHATYLIKHAVVSLPAIAKRLGHSSPVITLQTYAHVYSDSDTIIANKIDDFLETWSKRGQD